MDRRLELVEFVKELLSKDVKSYVLTSDGEFEFDFKTDNKYVWVGTDKTNLSYFYINEEGVIPSAWDDLTIERTKEMLIEIING